jgi:hypothetical protein
VWKSMSHHLATYVRGVPNWVYAYMVKS